MMSLARKHGASAVLALAAVVCTDTFDASAQSDTYDRSDLRAYTFQVPIWTGVYAGLQAGVNNTSLEAPNFISYHDGSSVYGGYVGINYQFDSAVVGLEADLNGDDAGFRYEQAGVGIVKGGVNASGTVRVRAGVLVGPALVYATAGYSWTDVALTATAPSGARGSISQTFDGYVYGIGAETLINDNISLRLEALQYDYGNDAISINGLGRVTQDFDLSSTVVRAGVSFHFK